jgi:alpha-mannosidase
MATYNWEVGTVQRPTAFDRQFEIASHHWIDLTDERGAYGATILTGAKDGSDKILKSIPATLTRRYHFM